MDRRTPVHGFICLSESGVRVVLQRVKHGKVTVDGRIVAEIDHGLVILLGIGHADGEEHVDFLVDKIAAIKDI